MSAWFCEAHRLWTTSDCPRCDAEQIADLDRYAKTPACHLCMRTLAVGEAAWASDWKVLDTSESALSAMEFRTETRYTCDDCEAAR